MKKKIISAVTAALMCLSTAANAAEYQRMDLTADGNWASSEMVRETLGGQTVFKLSGNSQTLGSKLYVTFNGFDISGKRISVDKKYMVVHYLLKNNAGESLLEGKRPFFQVDNFYKTEDGKDVQVKTASGNVSSGFITGSTAFVKDEWAPLMVNLERDSINEIRSDNPDAWYKTLRMYPAYDTAANTMSDDDTVYMKYVDFYTEQPSNAVYSPSVSIENGVISGKARLYHFAGAQEGCVMMLARYDSDGNLSGCEVKEIAPSELSDGFNDISIEKEYDASKDADVKMFIWDSLTGMNALCDTVSAEYDAPISGDNEVSYSVYGMGAVNPAE